MAHWAIFQDALWKCHEGDTPMGILHRPQPVSEPMDAAKPSKEEATAIVQWEYEDSVASYLLSQRLPDTTEMRLAKLRNHPERWAWSPKSTRQRAHMHKPTFAKCSWTCAAQKEATRETSSLAYAVSTRNWPLLEY